jgi:cell wall-associated NlpC family hydrolase
MLPSFAQQLAGRLKDPRAPAAAKNARDGAPTGSAASEFDPLRDVTPTSPERAELLRRAHGLLGIPYVWGGDTPKGLDCSSFVSRVWGVTRQTTDTLSTVADPIAKDELRAGDVMNLPTGKDPEGLGHVRMFDRWADPAKTKMLVYEETSDPGQAVHRVLDYDARYQPMRLRGLAG